MWVAMVTLSWVIFLILSFSFPSPPPSHLSSVLSTLIIKFYWIIYEGHFKKTYTDHVMSSHQNLPWNFCRVKFMMFWIQIHIVGSLALMPMVMAKIYKITLTMVLQEKLPVLLQKRFRLDWINRVISTFSFSSIWIGKLLHFYAHALYNLTIHRELEEQLNWPRETWNWYMALYVRQVVTA